VFTGSGVSFVCPDMNKGEYQTWHTLGQGSATDCQEQERKVAKDTLYLQSRKMPHKQSTIWGIL